jgi:hypothetical protein
VSLNRNWIGGRDGIRTHGSLAASVLIAWLEVQGSDDSHAGSTLHLRGVEDVTTMHVKKAVADLLRQLPNSEPPRASRPRPNAEPFDS